jgi:integrase
MPGELLAAYDRERLRSLSADRRCTAVRVLNDYASQPDAACSSSEALRAFLQAQAAAGYADGTVRKARAIVLAYAAWCWREGQVSGDQLLELRAVRPPIGSGARAQPKPYRLGELRELRRVLDLRWPRLSDDEARRWVKRWRDGRSPYSRIRPHAIRTQLDAIIALRCGLRRDEMFRLDERSIHPDVAHIVIWEKPVIRSCG